MSTRPIAYVKRSTTPTVKMTLAQVQEPRFKSNKHRTNEVTRDSRSHAPQPGSGGPASDQDWTSSRPTSSAAAALQTPLAAHRARPSMRDGRCAPPHQ